MCRIDRRLCFEHVHRCTGYTAFVQCIRQSLTVHDRAAGSVDEYSILFHESYLFTVYQAGGFLCLWHVYRHYITLCHQRVEIHEFQSIDIFFRPGICQRPAAEGLCYPCHSRADGACSDDAESLPFQFRPDEACLGAAFPDHFIASDDVPVKIDDEAEHQVRHSYCGIACTVGNCDAFFTAVIHIHMVVTGESDADIFQVRTLFHDIPAVSEIGKHHHIGSLASFYKCWCIFLSCFITYDLIIRSCCVFYFFFQFLIGNTQRFKNCYFHFICTPFI